MIFAMLISSGGGFVLERAIRHFPAIASYQPVINGILSIDWSMELSKLVVGVGGNLAAVQASRLSTYFHQAGCVGELPNGWSVTRFTSFSRAFFTKGLTLYCWAFVLFFLLFFFINH